MPRHHHNFEHFRDEVLEEFKEHQKSCYELWPECHPSVEHSFYVLLEEVDESKVEMHSLKGDCKSDLLERELMDVAHSALRFIIDLRCRAKRGEVA